MPGYPPDLSSYLFGSILAVTRIDLLLMAISTSTIVAVVLLFFDYWKSYLFDEEFAAIIGVRTVLLEYLLFIMIAVAVVVLIRVVGIVLILALFSAPTAIAGLYHKGLKFRMLLATIIGGCFCLTGLYVSYLLNLPSGSSIVIIAAIGYLSANLIALLNNKLRKRTVAVSG